MCLRLSLLFFSIQELLSLRQVKSIFENLQYRLFDRRNPSDGRSYNNQRKSVSRLDQKQLS